MDNKFIQQIHDQKGKFVFAVTGGGTSAITALLAVPGASNTLLSASMPYHEKELNNYLGGKPDQACSSRTARALAMVSWQRATKLEQLVPVYGVGCSAALATNRDRRGADRCHIAIQAADTTKEISVIFDKSGRSRIDEERLCAEILVGIVAETLGIKNDYLSEMRESDAVHRHQASAQQSWQRLFATDTSITTADKPPALIFPGAFNPIHQGHTKMMSHAEQLTGEKATLEISIFNVDKPPLDFIEMQYRRDALQAWPLIFSNAATFIEKCRLFPGATFMVGIDTLIRIIEPSYYHTGVEHRDEAVQEIVHLGNRFIVFGRRTARGFLTLADLDLPASLSNHCINVSANEFHEDVSSSEKRTESALYEGNG